MTLKNIIERLLILIDKKRLLLPMPYPIASITAKFSIDAGSITY